MKKVLRIPLVSLSLLTIAVIAGCSDRQDRGLMIESSQNPSPDLSSPEVVLAGYISCLEIADEQCVLQYLNETDSFYVSEPEQIDYQILERSIFTQEDVNNWNNNGILPEAQLDDVELRVQQTFTNANGESFENNFVYNFRNYDGSWRIYAYSAEGME